MDTVVRVAVNNNFNCTTAEFNQLDDLSRVHPESLFFINTNIKTAKLLEINNHPYKAVITLNPDIKIDRRQVRRLYSIASDLVAFTRIKYIPGNPKIVDLIQEVSKTHPVVITLQRFNSIKTASEFLPDFRKHYKFSSNRFRLSGKSLETALKIADSNDRTYICDRSGTGCGGCGLCSTLTATDRLPIYTLNLSSSGICPYNCVDCYAKTMQHFLRKINKPVIHFDWIHLNHKQSGKTEHIKQQIKANRK
jgi:hypothetical protein